MLQGRECHGIVVVGRLGWNALTGIIQINGASDPNDLGPTSKGRHGDCPQLVALVWPLRLEGRCQAPNVEVVAGDLCATPKLLKSHMEKNLLSPISNIRAVTSKLCARARLAIAKEHRL